MASDWHDAYQLGREAWPGIALDEARFAAALGDEPPAPAHAGDFYLASAAAYGVPAALDIFEKQHMSRVPLQVAHLRLSSDAVDELCQRLRESLLLPRGDDPPKLREYAGRGALGGWLRVVAVRAALEQLRGAKDRRDANLDEALPFLDSDGDEPELRLLRTHFRPRFVEALRAAAQTLTPRERNLLRLSLIDELTLEQMAPLFAVTKSTVHRWLEEARRRFLREVQRFFVEQLGLSASELQSVARLLESQVDFSLPWLLRTG